MAKSSDIPGYKDAQRLLSQGIEIVAGGFPCQDISTAGKGAGLSGARSGLWREMVRTIRLVRPRFALVENVAALLGRGLGAVLGDLAKVGYDTEWHCIQAADVGAPHIRDRVWILAHTECFGVRRRHSTGEQAVGGRSLVSDALGVGRVKRCLPIGTEEKQSELSGSGQNVSNADIEGLEERKGQSSHDEPKFPATVGSGPDISNPHRQPPIGLTIPRGECHHWSVEPDMGRVASRIPLRVDRLKGLGNAIVPQVAEIIFKAIKNQKIRSAK